MPWASFHRHTAASMLFEHGRNAKQVQRWLGHHSAAFTLDTYIHLLSDESDETLMLPSTGPASPVATQQSGVPSRR